MSGRRLFPQHRMLTWLSSGVLALGLLSFVLGLTFSSESASISWAQPVVVDGEEADPLEDAIGSTVSDHQAASRIVLAGSRIGHHAPPWVTRGLVHDIVFFDLASRPPPVL
ncbi:protein of unknown function [Nitrospira japonica]|uniref:Uncharacterized protein n=1 Tax=Nitrospira japonica TaxID=1325564 RepID=A0A1W1I7F7_9BACT|nr:hypothetical protein [Nitrospira japonica]SLM48946.1 protein of unknown function [Nitrospira japonica]